MKQDNVREYWWAYKGFEIRRNPRGQCKVFFKGNEVDLESIALNSETPVYVINGDNIREKIAIIKRAFSSHYSGEMAIHFAMKASHIPHVLRLLANEGCGIDAASPNEARLALDIGIPSKKILFTGTSVSDKEIRDLMAMNVQMNIDSFSQLRRLSKLVKSGEVSSSLLPLSIRINPDVGAIAGKYEITGGARTPEGVPIKFGIEPKKILDAFRYAAMNDLLIDTLHFHIGSGWLRQGLGAFRQAVKNILRIYKTLLDAGFKLKRLDVGGGAGIRYQEKEEDFPWDEYARAISLSLEEAEIKPELLILEPGEGLLTEAGVMLTRVNTVEEKYGIEHVYVDSGMESLPVVRMYGKWREIVNVSNPEGSLREYAVDGDVCETGDTFTRDELRELPEVSEGDILAFLDVGSYQPVKCFNYCLRGRPHVMLRTGENIINCTKGVEKLEAIMARYINY